jgi:glycosidase
VNAEEKNPESVLNYYKRMIRYRHEHSILVYGDFTVYDRDNPDIFIYTRTQGDNKDLVILNMSDKQMDYNLPADIKSDNWDFQIGNYSNTAINSEGNVNLRPWEAAVFKLMN